MHVRLATAQSMELSFASYGYAYPDAWMGSNKGHASETPNASEAASLGSVSQGVARSKTLPAARMAGSATTRRHPPSSMNAEQEGSA